MKFVAVTRQGRELGWTHGMKPPSCADCPTGHCARQAVTEWRLRAEVVFGTAAWRPMSWAAPGAGLR
jgi:hypothetical protein